MGITNHRIHQYQEYKSAVVVADAELAIIEGHAVDKT